MLDTALALQLVEAGPIIVSGATAYRDALVARAREHAETLCVGRTHGVHAEPTTFGLRLAGFAFEADRNLARLRDAFEQAAVGKLSGAVGTYASIPPAVEAAVMDAARAARRGRSRPRSSRATATPRCSRRSRSPAPGSSASPRRSATCSGPRCARSRSRSPPASQKGSSAMPHKRNPITAERICGLARVLRGYSQAGLENVALWHERDISHSGAERVILPDATILLDYMQHLSVRLVEGMTVHADRMRANLELTHGALFSQRALTALIESGMTRDEAYRLVQEAAQGAWDTGTPFRELLAEARRRELDLDAVLDYDAYLAHVPEADRPARPARQLS